MKIYNTKTSGRSTEIVDNLDDKSTDKALSANQGTVLKEMIEKSVYDDSELSKRVEEIEENQPAAGEIILSGSNLEDQGYRDLDQDLILTKTEAPELYKIFTTPNLQLVMTDTNSLSAKVSEVYKDWFMYNEPQSIFISKDFSMNEKIEITAQEQGGFEYFCGAHDSFMYFLDSSMTILTVVSFDYENEVVLSQSTQILEHLPEERSATAMIEYFGFFSNGFSYTYPRDRETGLIDFSDEKVVALEYPNSLDTNRAFLQNGFLLEQGKFKSVDPDSSIEAELSNYVNSSGHCFFFITHFNEFDFVNINIAQFDSKMFKIDKFGNVVDIKRDTYTVTETSACVFHHFDENVFAKCQAYSVGLYRDTGKDEGHSFFEDGSQRNENWIKGGDNNVTYKNKTDIVGYQDLYFYHSLDDTGKTGMKSSDFAVLGVQKSMSNCITKGPNNTWQISALIKLVDMNPETFTIKAVPSASSDKKNWIEIK